MSPSILILLLHTPFPLYILMTTLLLVDGSRLMTVKIPMAAITAGTSNDTIAEFNGKPSTALTKTACTKTITKAMIIKARPNKPP